MNRNTPPHKFPSERSAKPTPNSSTESPLPGGATHPAQMAVHNRTHEHKVYGRHAVQALFKHRPDDIVRVYLTESRIPTFAPLLKWCAQTRRAYHIVTGEDLSRVADTKHHEGVCLLAKRPSVGEFHELMEEIDELPPSQPLVFLLLDGIRNPHNVGAIIRSAAHFHCHSILIANGDPRLLLSGAALRIAEGGTEWVSAVHVNNAQEMRQSLMQRGFTIIGTSSHSTSSLFDPGSLPPRAVIALGSEGQGLSGPYLHCCDKHICIPGSQHVESLNVATAASIALSEFWRVHKPD